MRMKLPRGQATPRTDGQNLCASCRHGQIMRTVRGDEQAFCHRFDKTRQIRERIEQCNRYKLENEPTVGDFEQLAWVINPDRNGRGAGFISAKDYQKKVQAGKADELPEIDDPFGGW